MSVKMDWMVCHCEVPNTNPDTFIQSRHQWSRPGKIRLFQVQRLNSSIVFTWARQPRFDVICTEEKNNNLDPLLQSKDAVVADELPKIPSFHCHLCHFIGMRVVHEGSRTLGFELVEKGFYWWDTFLVQTNHTVHTISQ